MVKMGYYILQLAGTFSSECLILAIIYQLAGNPEVFNSTAVLICFLLAVIITAAMTITDRLTFQSSMAVKIIVDLLVIFAAVVGLGDFVLGWFNIFHPLDMLNVIGVIAAVYIIVFAMMTLRLRIDSDKINRKIMEMREDKDGEDN